MNLTPSLGLPVSTVRRASTPVEKPEPVRISGPAPERARVDRPWQRVAADERTRVIAISILPSDLAWLKAHGGASKAIRCLVEAARTAEAS